MDFHNQEKWKFKQKPQATPQMPNKQFGQAEQSFTNASRNAQYENYNNAEFDNDGGYLNCLDNIAMSEEDV